jgi:O-antigen ligase
MRGVFVNYLILSLYFFIYIAPAYIGDLLLAYDKVFTQMFIVSLLNIFSFIYIYKNFNLKEYISNFEYKNHYLSYFLFVVISIISLLVAENFIEGVVSLVKTLNLFIAFSLIVILSSFKNFKFFNYFLIVTLISLFIESVLINYRVFDSVIINGNLLVRSNAFSGFGANINISAFSTLIKTIVPIYLLFNYKNYFIRALSLFFIFSSFLTILLLMSRAGALALFLVLMSILILVVISKRRIYYLKYSLIIITLIMSIFSYNTINEKNAYSTLTERFSNVANPRADDSVNERLNFYTTAIQSIGENPLLGIGIGNWKIKSIDLSKDIIVSYRVPYFVHNDFLQTLAEIGIIGGLCFMFYIFYPIFISFLRSLKSRSFNLDFMIFLIFVIYIVDSMLNFPIERPINYIYLCFTIALFYQSKKYLNK